MSNEFSPIRPETLRANCPFDFDLYIRINEKYILYIRKGDEIEDARLDKFKQIQKLMEKSVERVFIRSEEEALFHSYMDSSIEEIVTDKGEPDDQMNAIMEIAENAVEVVFNDPTSVQAFQFAEKAAKGLRKVIQSNPKALKNIFQKKGRQTDTIENHCKNTAGLALKLAFGMGFRGEDLDNLGTAALLHDLGLINLKKEEQEILFKRPPQRFSPDDKRIYQTHVNHSVQMAASKPFMNEKVINLIAKHEEKNGGNGYPNKTEKLEPLEQILSLANCFDKKISILGMNVSAAFKELQVEEMGNYELKYFQKLREILMAEELFSTNTAEPESET